MKDYILVIDSGLGGINILKSLKNNLKNENFLYVLDNKNCPYGNKSKEYLIQNAIFLIDKFMHKYKIKLIIFACNTLTSVAIEDVRFYLKNINIDIKSKFNNIDNKNNNKNNNINNNKIDNENIFDKKDFNKNENMNNICVVGTEPPIKMVNGDEETLIISTKQTLKYNKILNENLNNENFTFIALDGIAKLVDENFFDRTKIIENLKKQIPQKNYKNIVLGCTHYYYLEENLKQVLNNPNLKFFSATNGVLKRVVELLNSKNNLKNNEVAHEKKIEKTLDFWQKNNENIHKKSQKNGQKTSKIDEKMPQIDEKYKQKLITNQKKLHKNHQEIKIILTKNNTKLKFVAKKILYQN